MERWEESRVKVKQKGIFEVQPEFINFPIQDESGDIAGFKEVFRQNHLIFTKHGKDEIRFRLKDHPYDKVEALTSGLSDLCTKYCGFLNQKKSNELYDIIDESISIFSGAISRIKELQELSNLVQYVKYVPGHENRGQENPQHIDVPLYLKSVSDFPIAAGNTRESLQSLINVLKELQPEKKHRGPCKKYGNFEQAVAELFTKVFGEIPKKTGKKGIEQVLEICFEGLGIETQDLNRRLRTIDNNKLENILGNNK